MRHHTFATGFLALIALAAGGGAIAQVQRSGGESQKLMQQYQQLAAERTALQAQVADMTKQLDGAKAEVAALKKERDAAKLAIGAKAAAAIAEANGARQAAEKNLEQSKQRMNELVGRFREMAQTLKDTETDRNQARQALTESQGAFDACAESNLQLYEINREILDRYEHVGLFTKAAAAEPFTHITRTRIENLVDAYRARAEELRVKKRSPP